MRGHIHIFLLFTLTAIIFAGCDIFSGKTEKKPFIDYKAGQTSLYEYTFSIQYPDSADFTLESVQRVNTVVKKTNAEITVDDNTLSNLVKIQVTVEEGSPHIQQQNTWFRYDDGYFTEYANSRSLGTISIPKIANNDPHEYQAFIQSQMKKFSPERMITGNFDIESFEADSIRLRTDPRLVHPRQFEIGKQWTTFSDPWLSKSRITEKKVVTDNDGFIDSYVIETENFLESSEFTYHTRFDSRGLVKRIVILEQTFRNEYGESIGEGITRSVVKRIGFSE